MGFLRNLFGTKQLPDPSLTQIQADLIGLQEEWRMFLEQQARITRRAAKRLRDDAEHLPVPEQASINDKTALRQMAASRGLFTKNRGA